MEVFLSIFWGGEQKKSRKLDDVSFFQRRKPKSVEDIDVSRSDEGRMNNSAHQIPLLYSFSGIERK